MSLILRHRPEKFGMTLDPHGGTSIGELTEAIASQSSWQWITEDHIRYVVQTDPKGRFEILESHPAQIRATYGHSITIEPDYPEVEPPKVLYHGTPRRAVEPILAEGLKSMDRQYVHLSTTVEDARLVGRRRDPKPAVLRIHAHDAWETGMTFYRATDSLYLARHISPNFIEVFEEHT